MTPSTKAAPETSGQLLKHHRQAKAMSLKEVELATRIRGKYLVALEADNYNDLPHDAYTRGFVQSYADLLGLDGKRLALQYLKEKGSSPVQLAHKTGIINTGPRFTPRSLTLLGGGALLMTVIGYLLWQFSSLAAPPKLQVLNPEKDKVLHGSLVTVNGKVGGGADVYVNDSPILSDANGNFSAAIALQDGINAIRVSAKNRLGKTATVTRNILAHVPQATPEVELPTATFDGVAATIQIKDATTSVTVRSDDKEVFNGTMLPGTALTFKGSSKVVVSTANAGATLVTVTNSVAAGRSLGPVGPLGQEKKDLEFDRDTQFQ
jgi:cytoskeletal protein RodZ